MIKSRQVNMLHFAANISLLFTELPLIDRVKAARDAGFRAIEIQFPYTVSAERLASAATAADLKVVLINAPVDQDAAVVGIASRADAKTAFANGLVKARDYAEALSVEKVNVLAGPGAQHGKAHEASLRQLMESLLLAAETLCAVGVDIMLEPLNNSDNPGYLIHTPAEAICVIEKCNVANLKLQFDAYHVAMMGLDPVDTFRKCLPHIGHIQFADMPGRHEPGTGTIDFPTFFRAVDDSGYEGWLGAEYRAISKNSAKFCWP